MIARPWWGLAAGLMLSAGGCALIAGYDFGKYGETGGAGTGGGSASASSGTSSGPASGGSSSGATTGSSSSSGMASSSGTTTGSSSGSTSSSSSTSSTSGGPIQIGLLGPEAIAVDTQRVYFTTNNPPSGPSTASSVFKDGTSYKIGISGAIGAPAVAASNSEGYAATWVVTGGNQQVGTISTYGPALPMPLGTVMDSTLGIAVWWVDVFFTTTGSKTWTITGGSAAGFAPSATEIASGPIAADAMGVYWSTVTDHMLHTDLSGSIVTTLCTLPDAVYAIATDQAYVYWTDASGGVYQVTKAMQGVPKTLNPPDSVHPAYGIAVSPGDGTVYFAQGTSVLRLQFPYGQAATAIVSGLVNPRGVAFDGANVYVAEKGTSNPSSPDGRIWKLSP